MGYVIIIGPCFACERRFGFNPDRVPSIPIDPQTGEVNPGGVRKPICRNCAELANEYRLRADLPLWDTSDECYAPAPE